MVIKYKLNYFYKKLLIECLVMLNIFKSWFYKILIPSQEKLMNLGYNKLRFYKPFKIFLFIDFNKLIMLTK